MGRCNIQQKERSTITRDMQRLQTKHSIKFLGGNYVFTGERII